jgi:hypothetical protein
MEGAVAEGSDVSEAPKLTTAQRLVLLVAANGTVMPRDPQIPTGIYRSLVHPHGLLRTYGNGYVITPEGKEAIRVRRSKNPALTDDDVLEAAE